MRDQHCMMGVGSLRAKVIHEVMHQVIHEAAHEATHEVTNVSLKVAMSLYVHCTHVLVCTTQCQYCRAAICCLRLHHIHKTCMHACTHTHNATNWFMSAYHQSHASIMTDLEVSDDDDDDTELCSSKNVRLVVQ